MKLNLEGVRWKCSNRSEIPNSFRRTLTPIFAGSWHSYVWRFVPYQGMPSGPYFTNVDLWNSLIMAWMNNPIHCKQLDVITHPLCLMMYFRSDIPQRRRYDLEKFIDSGESGLEIMIIEAVMNNKERWVYVMGYKPPDVRRSVFIDAFSLICDLILQESNNVIVLGDYNCNFMSDNALKDICISFGMHNLVNAPTCHKTSAGTLVDICLVS